MPCQGARRGPSDRDHDGDRSEGEGPMTSGDKQRETESVWPEIGSVN
jgi:hypothetical protein